MCIRDRSNLRELKQHLDCLRSDVALKDREFDEQEVYEALCKINPSKSPGLADNISGHFLVKGAVWTLTKIFNIYISGALRHGTSKFSCKIGTTRLLYQEPFMFWISNLVL